MIDRYTELYPRIDTHMYLCILPGVLWSRETSSPLLISESAALDDNERGATARSIGGASSPWTFVKERSAEPGRLCALSCDARR